MAGYTIEALYTSLPSPPDTNCIRLLHVHAPAAVGGFESPIFCDLTVEDMNSRPFVALSYVWGDSSDPPETIECRGVRLPVTSNCLSALRHLRDKLGSFIIWVDAVCISQKDVQEKAQQIPLMGDIYMNATTTYLWLGEGNEALNRAMDYLSWVGYLEYYFNDTKAGTEHDIRQRPWAALFHYLTHRWSFDSSLTSRSTKTSKYIIHYGI